MKKSDSAKKIVSAALFAALTFVATLIHIHFPGMVTGYVNIGDTMVIASAILLGPVYGAAAAAVGSALTDLFHGYVIYVPGTFVIKFIMAVGVYFVFRLLSGKHKEIKVFPVIIAGVVSELVMIVGYFLYEGLFIVGFPAASVGIYGNCVQGGFSIVLSVLLLKFLGKSKVAKSILNQ